MEGCSGEGKRSVPGGKTRLSLLLGEHPWKVCPANVPILNLVLPSQSGGTVRIWRSPAILEDSSMLQSVGEVVGGLLAIPGGRNNTSDC